MARNSHHFADWHFAISMALRKQASASAAAKESR